MNALHRIGGGAALGAGLGAYVAPEGHTLEGAGIGALGGGLAGAGSLAFKKKEVPYRSWAGGPNISSTNIAAATPSPEQYDAMRQAYGMKPKPSAAPVSPLGSPNIAAAAPPTSVDADAMRQAMGLAPKPGPAVPPEIAYAPTPPADSAGMNAYMKWIDDNLRFGDVGGKTAAWHAGQASILATLGLEKTALMPVAAAAARTLLPAAGRAAATGARALATKLKPAAATAGKVMNHPVTTAASMVPSVPPRS